ncbi:coiled coil domain-containing protein [bacterium]|nr:coiled coil domain-containing protein [bacterium]
MAKGKNKIQTPACACGPGRELTEPALDTTKEDRKAYIDKMAAKLKAWDDEVQKLEGKADMAKAEVKAKYHEQINELRVKKEAAQQQLEKIQGASKVAWEELKEGIEQSWKILGDSVKSARDQLK